jgi:hypothetical protein
MMSVAATSAAVPAATVVPVAVGVDMDAVEGLTVFFGALRLSANVQCQCQKSGYEQKTEPEIGHEPSLISENVFTRDLKP